MDSERHDDARTQVNEWLQHATDAARAASRVLARLSEDQRNGALRAIAAELRARSADIVAANSTDIAAFDAAGGTPAFRDRLTLTPGRVEATGFDMAIS